MVTEKALPFHYQFAAGAVAGLSEIIVMYPLDLIKTRIQLQVGKGTGTQSYNGVFDAFSKIIRNEGFKTLYRGITAPMLMEVPKRAIKFNANEQWGVFYLNAFSSPSMTQPLSILTGATAGATESVVVVPFELIKIRLQDQSSAGKYRGPLDVLVKTVRGEGLLAIYNGFEATLLRHIVWNAGYFGCIFQVRALLPAAKDRSSQKMWNDLVAGFTGGVVGTCMNTPLDVVKSRIQSSPRVPGLIPKYNWAGPALVTVARGEGFLALYKGFLPKVLRFGPGGGILLVVYTAVTDLLRRSM